MNRQGSFAIIGSVIFFCMLLLFALLLWTNTKNAQEPIDTQTEENSLEYQTNLLLIGILRSPFPVDVNGDGVLDKTTLADAIAIGKGSFSSVIVSRMPKDIVFEMRIVYANGTESTIRSDDFSNRLPSTLEWFRASLPSAEILLPSSEGNVRVVLQGADEQMLRNILENGDYRHFEGALG